MKSAPSLRKRNDTGSMTGTRFYVLFFGAIVLLWAIVTVFGHR